MTCLAASFTMSRLNSSRRSRYLFQSQILNRTRRYNLPISCTYPKKNHSIAPFSFLEQSRGHPKQPTNLNHYTASAIPSPIDSTKQSHAVACEQSPVPLYLDANTRAGTQASRNSSTKSGLLGRCMSISSGRTTQTSHCLDYMS
jgi:hypothetical protein